MLTAGSCFNFLRSVTEYSSAGFNQQKTEKPKKRTNKKTMGFGADISISAQRDVGEILSDVQQHDLLKFGIIPELIGRLPVIASLDSLKKDDLVRILTEPKTL